MLRRFDQKLSGARQKLDPPPGYIYGVLVQDPVHVYTNEFNVTPTQTLHPGHEEFFFDREYWFGSPDKARFFLTEYKVD